MLHRPQINLISRDIRCFSKKDKIFKFQKTILNVLIISYICIKGPVYNINVQGPLSFYSTSYISINANE